MYGQNSIWAIIISALLFIYVGKQILLLGKEVRATSINSINIKVFGPISPIVTGYLILTMAVICTAMLAGSGALFQEYVGINGQIGILISALIAIVVMFFGVNGILSANTIIVPILFAFNIFVFAFNRGFDIPQKDIGFISGSTWDVIKSGVSYAAFNLVLSAGVLASMGTKIDNPKILAAGGILGGVILGIMLAASNYCLFVHIPYIYNYEIPMIFIVEKMGSVFLKFYAFVLWGSIFTTLIGNLFTICSIIYEKTNLSPLISSIIVLSSGYFLSFLGFSGIVSTFYLPLGLIGILFVLIIIFTSLRKIRYMKYIK